MTTRYALLPLLLLAGCTAPAAESPAPPQARTLSARAAALPSARHAATVLSCHDGDTFTAMVAFDDPVIGAKGDVLRKVRILGINAPELSKPGGKEARAALVALLAAGPVEVEPDKDDDFGRLLCRVWAGGVNVGDEMIRSGNAVPFMTGK